MTLISINYPGHDPEQHSKGFSRRWIPCVMPVLLNKLY